MYKLYEKSTGEWKFHSESVSLETIVSVAEQLKYNGVEVMVVYDRLEKRNV